MSQKVSSPTAEEKINFEKWVTQLDRMDEEKYSKKAEELEVLSEEIIRLQQELKIANETIHKQAEQIKLLESKISNA